MPTEFLVQLPRFRRPAAGWHGSHGWLAGHPSIHAAAWMATEKGTDPPLTPGLPASRPLLLPSSNPCLVCEKLKFLLGVQRPTLEHNGEVDRNQVDSLEEGVVISGTWGVGKCEATFCTAWATSTVVPINGERSLLRSVMKSLPVMDFFRFNFVCIQVGWWGWDRSHRLKKILEK